MSARLTFVSEEVTGTSPSSPPREVAPPTLVRVSTVILCSLSAVASGCLITRVNPVALTLVVINAPLEGGLVKAAAVPVSPETVK